MRILEDIDPHAFQMYHTWLKTGDLLWEDQSRRLPNSTPEVHTCRNCWLLINAHILGYRIGAFAFSNCVMDRLRIAVTDSVWADMDTITHLFQADSTDIPDVLQLLVVDRCQREPR